MLRIILGFVLLLAPLLTVPGVFLYFDITPKVAVLLIGTAAGLVITDPLKAWNAIRSDRHRQALFLLLAAQCVSLVVATVFSTDPALSFAGTNWRRFGLVTQLCLILFLAMISAELAARPGGLTSVHRAVSIGVIAAAGYALAQYVAASAGARAVPVWETMRPPGPLGHPVYLGNYLAGAAFICFAGASRETRRAWKIVGLAAGTLGLAGVLLSGTRAAILGSLAGGAVATVFLRPRWRPRHVWWTAVPAAALVLIYLSPAGYLLRNRAMHWIQDPAGGPRLAMWRDTAAMIAARPILGYGLETFSREFPKFQSADLASRYPDSYHESPHNIWLDALVSQGAAGFLILLGAVGVALQASWKRPEPAAWRGMLAAGLAAGAFAHLFACFTVPTALYFWLAPVLLVAGGESPGVLRGGNRLAARTALSVLAGALLAAALLLVRADMLLAGVRRQLDGGRLEEAVAGHRAALGWPLPGFSSELWYSRALIFAADRANRAPEFMDRALEAAGSAADQTEDRHNALYHLALLQTSAGDLPAAEATLRHAIGVAPNWYKPHWLLAEVLRSRGRLREALREAESARALNPKDERELQETLAAIRQGLASEAKVP